jgi:hypothetical protein
MFLPAQQIDFLSGTRQKMPILSSGVAPFVFSYLRSRSSFVFLFGEIPIFLPGTREKIKIFCRVRVKKMPISSPGAALLVFSYLRSCSSCVFLFEGSRFFCWLPGKKIQFHGGSRSSSVFLAMTC